MFWWTVFRRKNFWMKTICGLRVITVLARKIWRLDENKSVRNLSPIFKGTHFLLSPLVLCSESLTPHLTRLPTLNGDGLTGSVWVSRNRISCKPDRCTKCGKLPENKEEENRHEVIYSHLQKWLFFVQNKHFGGHLWIRKCGDHCAADLCGDQGHVSVCQTVETRQQKVRRASTTCKFCSLSRKSPVY